MKIAVFADKGMGRWFAQLFDNMSNVTFYLSPKNKHGLNISNHSSYIFDDKTELKLLLKSFLTDYNQTRWYRRKEHFYYFQLEELVKNNAFDIAITKSERSLYSLAKLKYKYNNFKIVYRRTRTIPYAEIFDSRSFAVRNYAFALIDQFLTTTKAAKQCLEFEGVNADKVTHIYSAVDCNKFTPLDKHKCRKELGLDTDKFYIVFVGKLVSWKNPYTLIYTIKKLKNSIANIHLLLSGKGAQEETLKTLVNYLNISKHVTFIGNTPYSNIEKLYNCADIFVLPSIHHINLAEQFAFAAIESVSCGIPTLVTKVGGMKEVVNNDENLLFEIGNYEELAQKILYLLNNGLLQQYSIKLRELALEKFNTHNNNIKVQELINSIS